MVVKCIRLLFWFRFPRDIALKARMYWWQYLTIVPACVSAFWAVWCVVLNGLIIQNKILSVGLCKQLYTSIPHNSHCTHVLLPSYSSNAGVYIKSYFEQKSVSVCQNAAHTRHTKRATTALTPIRRIRVCLIFLGVVSYINAGRAMHSRRVHTRRAGCVSNVRVAKKKKNEHWTRERKAWQRNLHKAPGPKVIALVQALNWKLIVFEDYTVYGIQGVP